jgi:hypothetical protein
MSIPLAHVFELGGDTIWAPAVLHFVVQSVPKVVTFENAEAAASFPLWWMAVSGLLADVRPAGLARPGPHLLTSVPAPPRLVRWRCWAQAHWKPVLFPSLRA